MISDALDYVKRELDRARDSRDYYRKQRNKWQAECQTLRSQLRDQTAQQAAMEALVSAAQALPDWMKTPALRRALSDWRKATHDDTAEHR